ncbi:MAG: sugar phosphate isomerase/epimerase [Oscillospiraceae bacterium]|nr:sugar phosphate isomerase/epimerase [Oscillospiraceae bacterium]
MIIACGTVLFRQYPLEKALEAIRETGYEFVETQAVGPWCPHVTVGKDDPVKYKELVKKHGFDGTTALWMPYGTILADEKCVEWGVLTLEWAKAAGIPVVNTGDGHKPREMDEAEAYKVYEDRMGRIVEAAEKNQTVIAIEPHGTFSLTSAGLIRLMSVSNSKWLGINYDTCNIRRAGYVESKGAEGHSYKKLESGEDELEVLKKIAGRVAHFHAKDYKDGACAQLGTGEVRLSECIGLLKENGYTGAVSLETEGDEDFDTSKAFAAAGLKYLRDCIFPDKSF